MQKRNMETMTTGMMKRLMIGTSVVMPESQDEDEDDGLFDDDDDEKGEADWNVEDEDWAD